jgi:hypothetical protein
MKRALIITVSLGLTMVGILFGYRLLLESQTNRFRLTIEVDTPDGIRSGSSVIRTRIWDAGGWGFAEARGVRGEAYGEAIFVDLGRDRNVVGILGWGPNGHDQNKIYGLKRAALASGARLDWKEELKLKGRGELPPDYVPTMLTFTDLNDPKSARIVRPDEFERVFGPGVRFRRAMVETTNDAAERQIEKKLKWWSQQGRPAAVAWRAWRGNTRNGLSVEPERFFIME